MKRTIPILSLLSLLALGGGCHSSCDTPGSVTWYWRFVGAPIAGTTRVEGTFDVDVPTTAIDETGCATAGVTEIDITVDGFTETVACAGPNGVPGARLPGFLRGAYDWRVDAIRNGVVAFTASGSTVARTCSDAPVDVDLRAVTPNDLVVYYDFNGQVPAACFGNGTAIANLDYELRDAANRTAATTCLASNAGVCTSQAANPCDPASFGFTILDLPVGGYSFAYLDAVDAAGGVRLSACQAPVRHDGFPVFVNLTTVSGGNVCTFPPPSLAPAASPAS